MSEEAQIVLRYYSPDDAPFVYSSWRNALWFSEKRENANSDEFYSKATKEIAKKIKNGKMRIACLSDDPNFIIGFSVMNKNCLDWIYVKIDYRKKGIGKLLASGFESVSEPITKLAKVLVKEKNLKVKGEINGEAKEE